MSPQLSLFLLAILLLLAEVSSIPLLASQNVGFKGQGIVGNTVSLNSTLRDPNETLAHMPNINRTSINSEKKESTGMGLLDASGNGELSTKANLILITGIILAVAIMGGLAGVLFRRWNKQPCLNTLRKKQQERMKKQARRTREKSPHPNIHGPLFPNNLFGDCDPKHKMFVRNGKAFSCKGPTAPAPAKPRRA